MVAIFAGLGSGFARGSTGVLGSAGQLGGALLGRGGEGVSVNAATGNLVLSRQDEFLVGRGLDAGISRTYNSIGQTGDRDNNDGWQQSSTQRIFDLTGTLNTASSTVKRLGADGSVVTYAWGTRGTVSAYWTTDGAGAHDRLVRSGSDWIWTDGDTQITETYTVTAASAAEWRLANRKDTDNNTLTFSYLAGSDLLDKVTTQNGEWLQYVWSGNTITQIITGYTDLATSTAKTLSRTWYDYTGGRLSQVRVDLTPEDNTSPTAAQSYWTQYSYDGAGRVTQILQKDGSQVDIVYDASGRVSTVTQQVASGDTRVTSLVYGAGFTSVTGPDGQVTRLDYDAAGQLTAITAPPAFAGAAAQVVQFAYDAEGNLSSVTDAGGKVTSYSYDASGNVTRIDDPNLNTVKRWYDSGNRLVLERSEGSDATGASVAQWTRYAYDAEGHLRYVIDREGRVTEYRYTAPGELAFTITYPEHQYTGQWSDMTDFHLNEGYANAWRDALADRSSIRQTTYTYDLRGNQTSVRSFGAATTAGVTATTDGTSRVYTTYDQAGRLLSRYAEGETAESFVYDGMGRLTASTDVHGGTTTFVFNDAVLTTTVTSSAGYASVQTFNKAGELVSSVGSGNYDVTGTSQLRYDKNGRVRMTVDETGYKSFMVYDRAGQLAGSVNHLGDLTEYRRDQAGRVIAEVRYAGRISAANLTTLENPDNSLQMSSLRPVTNAADIWSWTVYDAAGRVVQTIDGSGGVAAFEYDQSGRLVRTTSYFTQVAVAGLKTAPPTAPVAVSAHANDTVTRSFYNRSGQMIGMLDGEGYLTEIIYDQAGQKVEEVAYATRTSSSLWASGSFAQLRTSADPANAGNRRMRYVYDGQGLLRYQIDGTGAVTSFAYNTAGKLTTSIAHAAVIAPASFGYAVVKAAVTAAASTANDRMSFNVYDGAGRLAYTIDATGAVTGFGYDAVGRAVRTVQYAVLRSTTSLPALSTMTTWVSGQAGNAANRTTRNYYTAAGLLRFSVDAEGYVRRYDYDAADRKVREVVWDAPVSVSDATTIDQVNSLAVGGFTDARWEYDTAGRVSSTYDGLGVRTLYEYNATGTLANTYVAHGTADQARSSFLYDGAGRVTHEYAAFGEPEQALVQHAYDGLGNRISTTSARGIVTTFTYDETGRILSMVEASGTALARTTAYQYNAFGDVVQTTDPRGAVTLSVYNRLGQLTRTTDALGLHTDYTYTVFGEMATVTRAGATTSFTYDKLGRVLTSTDANRNYADTLPAGALKDQYNTAGGTESYAYNAFGNRTSVTNKLGGVTTYAYDRRGLLVSETLPTPSFNSAGTQVAATVTNTFSYDARGNRVQMVEAAGLAEARTTSYAYDRANRMVSTTGQTFLSQTPVTTYAYDARGNMTLMTDPAGARTVYYYDDLGRVTATISPVGTYTATSYDAGGNVTGVRVFNTAVAVPANGGARSAAPALPSGGQRETVFTYDALGRMTKSAVVAGTQTGFWNGTAWVASANAIETVYEYDANGNVVKATDPNGNAIFSYYDLLGRKTAQIDAEGYRTDWTYDADGNVLTERRYWNRAATPGTAAAPAVTADAALDRITSYTYDLNGNRLSEARSGVEVHNGSGGTSTVTATVSYLYNGLGQVIRKTEATGDQINYTYDVGGRLTVEARQAFTDQTGASVTPTVDYFYDGLGNLSRTRQRGNANAAERVTTYGYNGGKLHWMTNAEAQDSVVTDGLTTWYWHDIAGRLVAEYYTRYNSAGAATTTYEGSHTAYDAAGRAVQNWQAVWDGTNWLDHGPRSVTSYNAHGEIVSVAVGGITQQQNRYDDAGRMWSTTSGDGVWKYFGYDRNGNQTIAIASAGAAFTAATTFQNAFDQIGQTNVNATYTVYDKRNMATQVVEEGRQLAVGGAAQNLTTSRSYNAFGEVAGETNALGATINYTYNTMGKLIRTESPLVEITLENGTVTNVRPTENYYYDAAGRLVASRDANGNLTRMTLLAGSGYGGGEVLVASTIAADGGVKQYRYDIHGDMREMIDELGISTLQTFDRMGRVTVRQEVRSAALTTDDFINYYSYDGLGQQLRQWNNLFGSTDAQTTDYDIQGRVIATRSYGGDTTTTSYLWDAAITTTGLGTFGGWTETITMANGRTAIEKTDLFGRITWSQDLGNRQTSYTYDVAGRLASSVKGGLTTGHTWLNNGQMGQMWYGDTGSGQVDTNWSRMIGTYSYDRVGNRLTEQLTSEAGIYTPAGWYQEPNPHPPGTLEAEYWDMAYPPEWREATYFVASGLLKNQSATYDALGRLRSWAEAGTASSPASSITNHYDAAGNVRRTQATWRTLGASGADNTTQSSSDFWFRYDSMNRLVVNRGQLVGGIGGVITRGTPSAGVASGQEIQYDLKGQRVSVISSTFTPNIYAPGGGYVTNTREFYRYDAAGRLTSTESSTNISATSGTLQSNYTYDISGRQTLQQDYNTSGTQVVFSRSATFNNKGQVTYDSVVTRKTDGKLYTTNTTYNYGFGTGYALGSVLSTTASSRVDNGSWTYSSTTNTYDWYDGAVQVQISYDSDTSTSSNQVYHTYFTNDGMGRLVSAYISDGKARNVTFINDELGQIIRRKEDVPLNVPSGQAGAPDEVWYRFAGRQMGYTGNNGTSDLSMAASIADRQVVSPSNQGTFRNNQISAPSYADFAQSYDPINSFYQGSAGGSYTVRAGDTLQGIAQALWGDASLWYKIAEANGMAGGAGALSEGQRLILPTGVTKNTHNADTFRPYDPQEAIGDLSPNTSPKPKKGKCGVLGQIFLAVVAVAVTLLLTPASGATFGQVLLGAIGGNLASQGVGLATGIQDKFSFKSLALTAVSAGVTAGIGDKFAPFGAVTDKTAGSLTAIANATAKGALASAITQGIGVATGLQNKFSWAGVAAAGVAAGVGYGLNHSLQLTDLASAGGRSISNIVGHTAVGAASLFASAATRSAIEGSSFGDNILAGLPDVIGQVIGRAVGGALRKPTLVDRALKVVQNREETFGDFDLGRQIQIAQGAALIAEGQGVTIDQVLDDTNLQEMLTRSVDGGVSDEDYEVRLDARKQILRESGYSDKKIRDIQSGVIIPPKLKGFANRGTSSTGSDIEVNANMNFALDLLDGVGSYVLDNLDNPYLSAGLFLYGAATAPVATTILTIIDYTPAGDILRRSTDAVVNEAFEGVARIADNYDLDLARTGRIALGGLAVIGGVALGAKALPLLRAGASKVKSWASGQLMPLALRGARPVVPARIPAATHIELPRPAAKGIDPQALLPRVRFSADTIKRMGPAPAGMKNPHRHHILEVNGRAGSHRTIIREGQDILRRYDIDPLQGVENLVWAPNKGHTQSAAGALVADLRAAEAAGASRSRIVTILRLHGDAAARR